MQLIARLAMLEHKEKPVEVQITMIRPGPFPARQTAVAGLLANGG
jgi:hypothetical protein